MIINATDSNIVSYDAINSSTAADKPVRTEARPRPAFTTEPVVDSYETSADNTVKEKGVLRLLQAGHFKGVADVRLRINFNDEITAMEQAETGRIAEENSTAIAETVNGSIDGLLQSDNLDEAAAVAMGEAQATFNAGLSNKTGDPLENLKSAFDQLVAAYNTIFEAPSVTEAESTTAADESQIPDQSTETVEKAAAEEISSFDYKQFISDLIEVFTQKFEEAQSAVDNVRVLPELSQPRGKGGAYDKFLAIYNQMNGQTPPEEPEVDTAV